MLVTLSGIVTLLRLLHPENALFPMLLMLSGKIISVSSPVYPITTFPALIIPTACLSIHDVFLKASLPMLITLSGIVTLVRLLHSSNADFPMLVTLSGIVTLVRLVHHLNAPFSMLVTLSGIVTLLRLVHLQNASSPILATLSGIVTLLSLVHHLNAPFSMLVTLSGIVTLVRLSHPRNASSPILVTLSGIKAGPSNPLYLFSTPPLISKSFIIAPYR